MESRLSRIAGRVRRGRHDVPEPVVRRRFERRIRNSPIEYRALADSRTLINNSVGSPAEISSWENDELVMMEPTLYREFVRRFE